MRGSWPYRTTDRLSIGNVEWSSSTSRRASRSESSVRRNTSTRSAESNSHRPLSPRLRKNKRFERTVNSSASGPATVRMLDTKCRVRDRGDSAHEKSVSPPRRTRISKPV